jgi:hypothetical protein
MATVVAPTPATTAYTNAVNSPLPTTAAPGSNAVYWIGQDGNVYYKGAGVSGGVINAGTPVDPAITPTGFSSTQNGKQVSASATRIADPNPGNPGATTNNTPASTTTAEDKSNDIAYNLAGLGQIQNEENAGTSAVSQALQPIVDQYNNELTSATSDYNQSSQENEQDLQSDKETAMQNAVQGRLGLYGTLASLGALNGTGLVLANNAVAEGANEDLGTAADTYAKNQKAVDESYTTYTDNEKKELAAAQSAGNNDTEIAQHGALVDQQNFLKGLVGDYAAELNPTEAANYNQQLIALQPQLAATNVPQTNISYAGSGAWSAPSLASYVGSANNTTVQPTTGTGVFNVPGLVAVNKKQTATAS